MYKKVKINPEKCTECMCCQLICSLTYTGSFNPEKSRIIVNPPTEIYFRDECIEECTLCIRYCIYGALTISKGE